MLETLPLRTQTTPTMIYDTLPTRSEFLATQLDIHRQCSICHEEFNLVHAPTRLTGRSSCNHVFGLTCICEWLLSGLPTANKCPMCRTLLFAPGKEREEDDDDYGDMPALTRLGPEEGGEDGDDEGDGNDSESSDREESSDEEDSDEDEGSSLFDDYVNHDGEQAEYVKPPSSR